MDVAAKTFFTAKYFAVAGASQNNTKFGYQILAWYEAHSLPVTAINPSRPNITVDKTDYLAIASPLELQHPTETSLSIVTPPNVTLNILKEAKEAGIRAIWLQPGSFNGEGLSYVLKEFEAGIGGKGGDGSEGWCLLVDGDSKLAEAKKALDEAKERL